MRDSSLHKSAQYSTSALLIRDSDEGARKEIVTSGRSALASARGALDWDIRASGQRIIPWRRCRRMRDSQGSDQEGVHQRRDCALTREEERDIGGWRGENEG